MSRIKCAACGHKPSDHEDGIMGAKINDKHLCHTDDHSCYIGAGQPTTLTRDVAPFMVIDLRTGRRSE